MQITIPWGKDENVNIQMPEKWILNREIMPRECQAERSPRELLRQAMEQPFGQMPLSHRDLTGKKTVIIVDDSTRPTPVAQLFPDIYQTLLTAGSTAEMITVIISLGTHSPMSERDIANRLGVESSQGLRIINHNCFDQDCLVNLGRTSGGADVLLNRELCAADLIVPIGTIEPHLLAGFGGGLKNVLPGCAGMTSIAATHLLGSAEQRFSSVGKMGEDCPTRMMLEEAAQKLSGEYFLVNTVLNLHGETMGVFCGDPILAHREGCRLAAKIYGTPVENPMDVMIAGSYPMDLDLRQGTKCLANASAGLKEDGLLIALIRCCQGVGDMTIPEAFLSLDHMRFMSKEIGTERMVELREKYFGGMSMDDKYMYQFLTEIFRRHRVLVYAPDIPADTGRRLGAFEVFADMGVLLQRAVELMPAGTVCSLPYGGTSYIYHGKE